MEIIYIANTGFIIRTSNKKILIDALFGKFDSDWCAVPSVEIVEKMERSIEPFDQIDVILVTHAHVDHFNPEIVIKHLESNKEGVLICPEHARQELEKINGYEKVKARVKEITPEFGMGSRSIDIKGIGINVRRLKHSSYFIINEATGRKYNKHKLVQNLGFTITTEDRKIFHGGDWAFDGKGQKPNPFTEEKIDLAFLGFGAYLRLYGPGSKTVDEINRPEDIILMHIPPSINFDELTDEEKRMISSTTVFRSPLESKCFDK